MEPRSATSADLAVLRPALHDDIERLRAIELAAGEPFRDLGMDAVAEDGPSSAVIFGGFVDRRDAWVLMSPDGAVIGFRLDASVDAVAHLEQVSVDPAVARRALGRVLIEHLIDLARTRGSEAVTLTAFVDVPWNGPYYRRLGFRELAEDELGPGLRAIRATERAHGLDRWPRCAMRRDLS